MPGGVNRSRMLARLDQEIATSPSCAQTDCKRAERAAYLARLGLSIQAKADLDALRHAYLSRPNAEVSAWLNLVDGLVGHFVDMRPEARDRILRAHALSSAAGILNVRALSAAWLAHMDYLRLNVPSMARYAAEALRVSIEQQHSVRSRVGLVLAQAYHLSGKLEMALPWYAMARDHAVAEGDDATLSALMHNMAWLRAQRLRASDCGLADKPSRTEGHALLAAEAVASFDSLIGSKSLTTLVPVLRAQILTVRKEYGEALAIFEAELIPALKEGMGRLHADLLADQAWCRVNVGQRTAALADAKHAELSIDLEGQFDDRALAYGRLVQVFYALEEPDSAQRNSELAKEAWAAHVSIQREIVDALACFSELRQP